VAITYGTLGVVALASLGAIVYLPPYPQLGLVVVTGVVAARSLAAAERHKAIELTITQSPVPPLSAAVTYGVTWIAIGFMLAASHSRAYGWYGVGFVVAYAAIDSRARVRLASSRRQSP
jgi:hypothetical protein